jgi:hypothetical protein
VVGNIAANIQTALSSARQQAADAALAGACIQLEVACMGVLVLVHAIRGHVLDLGTLCNPPTQPLMAWWPPTALVICMVQ